MRRRSRKEEGTGAIPIGRLFDKYKNRLRPPQSVVITAFCAVVEKELGATLSSRSVRYAPFSKTLRVTASGPLRSEILIARKKILTTLKEVLGLHAPEHII